MAEEQTEFVTVTADEGSRLNQLNALYAQKKPELDKLSDEVKTLKEAIQAELQAMAPGKSKVVLASRVGKNLQLSYRTSVRVNTKALKTEVPEIYEQYATVTGYWELRGVA